MISLLYSKESQIVGLSIDAFLSWYFHVKYLPKWLSYPSENIIMLTEYALRAMIVLFCVGKLTHVMAINGGELFEKFSS